MSKHSSRIIYFMSRYGVSYDEAVKMVKSEYEFEASIHDGTYWQSIDSKYLDTLDAKPEVR
jgi:hypothetical protein